MAIEDVLAENESKDLLRILTAGSVDDGKSTLIGRLLFDSKLVYEDHLSSLEKDSKRVGSAGDGIDYSLLLDGLQAEREQGITIDVAYRYFSTPRRKFIIADSPGHEQYTRNMATGASTANLGILLVDARHGVVDQTRRHTFITSLLGIKHLVVAVNKMDLVDFDRKVFEGIRREFSEFAARLEVPDVHFIPISALDGDNVVERSARTPWYEGSSLLHHLETVHIASDRNLIDLRFPVQYVLRQSGDFRGYCGTVASGLLRRGDEVLALPSGKRTRVERIVTYDGDREVAFPPMAVTVALADEIDLSRGDCLVHARNVPTRSRDLEAMVVWLSEDAMSSPARYLLKHGSQLVQAEVTDVRYRTNVNTLRREEAGGLGLNEIGRLKIVAARPLLFDPYAKNRANGAFILIDPVSNGTVAAGMLLDRKSDRRRDGDRDAGLGAPGAASSVSAADRAARLGHGPATLWVTGGRAADREGVCREVEARLFAAGVFPQVLDHASTGLEAREGVRWELTEHVRRTTRMARGASRLGLVTLVPLAPPLPVDRDEAREALGAAPFAELHLRRAGDVADGEAAAPPAAAALVELAGDDLEPAIQAGLDLVRDLGGATG